MPNDDIYSKLDDWYVDQDYILSAYLEWERNGMVSRMTRKEMSDALGVNLQNIRNKVNDLESFRRNMERNDMARKVAEHCMEADIPSRTGKHAIKLVVSNGAKSALDLPGIAAEMPIRHILNDVFRKEHNNGKRQDQVH
jgi:adenylosuccinate lyase